MAISSYPQGFRGGALIKELPFFDMVAGDVYWVDSGNGSSTNAGTFSRPLATLDQAINKCTANNGDRIYLYPGHSEAISAAAGAVFDVAGITVVGMGHARDMSQIRFTTATTADINIDSPSTRFINVRFTAAFADVAVAIDVAAGAHGTEFHNCLFDEEIATENYVVVINIADGADDFHFMNCIYDASDASNDKVLEFAGTHENVKIVGNIFKHKTAQGTTVHFITSATDMFNCTIIDNAFATESTVTELAFIFFDGLDNTGWAIWNVLQAADAGGTGANAIAGFDVTGLFCKYNGVQLDGADARNVETFLTVENFI